jgi:hypothetical protein
MPEEGHRIEERSKKKKMCIEPFDFTSIMPAADTVIRTNMSARGDLFSANDEIQHRFVLPSHTLLGTQP